MTDSTDSIPLIRCPECEAELVCESALQLRCAGCARQYPVIDDIASVARNPAYYYGEIPQSNMRELLVRLPQQGLERALRETMRTAKDPEYFIDYAVREGRAGWMFGLPIRERSRILDVGCGPGSIAVSLAQHGHEVFGLDLTLERVQFMMLRAKSLGLNNVFGIHGGDGARLPFAPATFDLLILNGVLEWLAEGLKGDNPYDIQLQFLRDAARVVRPDGHVYIGIENRYGKDYFFGKREEHARIPWVSLLPRKIADLYAQIRIGKPYRTWTYSRRGLSSLLRKAGFKNRRLLLPIPDYREFFRIVDGESKASIGSFLSESPKKRLLRAAGGRTLLPYLAPSFGMLGGKTKTPQSSWLSRLAQSSPALRGSTVERYLVTSTDTVVVGLRSNKDAFILRVPLNAAALQACIQNELVLQRLKNHASPWLPTPIESAEFEQSRYFVETAVEGRPISPSRKGTAMRFLLQLHRTPVPHCNWAEFIAGIRSSILPYFEGSSVLSELVPYIEERLESSSLPRVLSHGDYWTGNILGVGNRITGVVDWSHAILGVPSMSDVLHLLIFERSQRKRVSIVDALLPFIQGNADEDESRLVAEYAEAMKIDLDLQTRGAFAALYWLEYLSQRLGRPGNRYAMNPRWLNDHLKVPASALITALPITSSVSV